MKSPSSFPVLLRLLRAPGRQIQVNLWITGIGERRSYSVIIYSTENSSVHWECSPCHFEYDLILHLEDVDLEYDYAWEKIADIKPVLRQQYANSPMAKHHPSWYWRNVPKDVAKKIYMIYFMGKKIRKKLAYWLFFQDLAGLGYSSEECMRYVNSASEADVLSLENIVKARSNLNHPELYMNQSYLHEICYWFLQK